VFDDTTLWLIGNSLYEAKNSEWVKRSLVNQFGWNMDGTRSGTSLFAFSTSDAWLIAGGIVWKYNGKVAKEHRLWEPPHNVLEGTEGIRAAWGTSSRNMFFVGDKGTIVHFDGSNWTKFPKVTQKNLYAVHGTSGTNVWAAGYNTSTAQSVLLHFDGVTWREDSISKLSNGIGGFIDVWTCDSAGHPLTIATGSLIWRKTGDGPWRRDSGRAPNQAPDKAYIGLGVRGNSANDFMGVGAWGTIIHWNGSTYLRYDELYEPSNLAYYTGAFSMGGNTAVAVGAKNGRSWIAVGRRK
jgi:hypothetical protein